VSTANRCAGWGVSASELFAQGNALSTPTRPRYRSAVPPHKGRSSLSLPTKGAGNFGFSEFSLDALVETGISRFHPVPIEGRLAIVTDAGRDAMDADVLRTNGT
jgi:hypothetical protein